MVDLKGFEPSTPTMRMWCAPNCATSPFDYLEIIAAAIGFVKCWYIFAIKNNIMLKARVIYIDEMDSCDIEINTKVNT